MNLDTKIKKSLDILKELHKHCMTDESGLPDKGSYLACVGINASGHLFFKYGISVEAMELQIDGHNIVLTIHVLYL